MPYKRNKTRRGRLAGILAVVLFYAIVVSCQSGAESGGAPVTPDTTATVIYKTTPYNWKKPANFPDVVYDFASNPLTVEGVALGKALFYDNMLSYDGSVSCSFCHIPGSAFAHTDHSLSHGFRDRIGARNVPGIENLAWRTNFFWDGGIVDLDLLPISPIQNPVEMGDTLANVLAKVRNSGKYTAMFKAAYGTEEVTTDRFLKSLSQFLLTVVSANSKYDKYSRKEGTTLTDQEARGLTLFKANCASCHNGELFTDGSFRNNGLPKPATASLDDQGRYAITLQEADKYKFRVPSLRNVDRTLPYMHDGRFQTLEQVLKHYAAGVEDNAQLDPLLKKNGTVGIPLSSQDQQDIIAFLRTLTDYDFLSNPQFQP